MISEQILLKGSLLWDGRSEDTIPNGCIVVEDKLIRSIYSSSEADYNVANFNRLYDFSGLLPG